MNFDEAIAVHAEWKMRLRASLSEPGRGGLDPDDIERDDRCDLGRWIHGSAASFADDPSFGSLAEQHRLFHALAAAVVRKAQSGDIREAEGLLYGEYSRRSSAVISAIMVMKQRAAGNGTLDR